MTKKQIDKIVWFIPIRKLRDHIRDTLRSRSYLKNFPCLFKSESDIYKQKEIFEYNISKIEIETHSFCNRRCWFCPNSIVDRHSQNIELDEKLYLKIINELSEINYSGTLNFNRFNEPLSYKELILKRIKQAKEKLPNATLGIFTNGDYLTTEYLNDLSEVGVSNMVMSYYFRENEQFNIEALKLNMQKNINKLNLEIKDFTSNNYHIVYNLNYNNLNIIYKASDFSKIGVDRGGVINGVKSICNEFSCHETIYALYIDYNGLVMPCCDLRSDIKEHKNMILGDISKNTIFEIFTSEKASKMPPCSTCTRYQ